ncbi:hypothetical protein PR048_015400 [Dryococelus australis]|uniref:Uncharacterized protein n=1 Tax=Dryococelus australis TaxID=614101 RepID=A0ABQ9HGU8_9NEOP|nr:hypothetical protein PR048_015400 [Dryococelus australis]
MQQCLPTPDLKTNIVYYKRQLWTMNKTIRDLGDDTSYCFMWHEALVGRGSDQMASVLYKHIQANIPSNVQNLTTFSDACAYHNIAVAIMFMVTIQQHPLKVVSQKFLVPGHSHLECDSDHVRIERAKKKMDVEIRIPHDWYLFVKTVRDKKLFTVYEMKISLGISQIPPTYSTPVPINTAKKTNLLSLLPPIDASYHGYYQSLTTSERQTCIGPDHYSEDDDDDDED